jgi:putative membrane protein
MIEMRIRPSTTLIIVTYISALALAALILYCGMGLSNNFWMAAFVVPAWMLASAGLKHIRSNFTTIEIGGDRLKFEDGMFSKLTRSVPLHKVQDVTVHQTLGQRLLGLGDLTIETAGETSRLTIREISSPREVAERILDLASGKGSKKKEE